MRSFLRGEAVHSNGSSKTECTIRDISDSGARIEAPASVTLPEYFLLSIPQRQIERKARIVWRLGSEIGVSFLDEGAGAPAQPNAVQAAELKIRMLELEAETARLRAQLAEMQGAFNTFIQQRKSA